ncbi:MAG: fused MFS/spermidine synthase [Acidobacteriota bacterium]|nr:fused MFS/spermidine synthase [Acidobacteriota bacterium]
MEQIKPNSNRFRDRFLLEIVVFVCGALVMIYEIVGSRILAPYIGTSTYVWTSLIGVILASLSLGYWLGGKMADRKPEIKVLSNVMFIAAALMSVTILLHAFVLSLISQISLGLEIKSILAAVLLFAPASVLLGFVTPYAVRLKMNSVENAGKTVGRLYALSTIGSILGTFLAGFFLLPFIGSVRTLYLLAGILFLLWIALAPFRLDTTNLFVLLLFFCGVSANEFFAHQLSRNDEFISFDTEYSRVQILRGNDKKTGKPIRSLTLDPLSTQSAIFLDSDELVLNYGKYYHLLRYFKPDFRETLIIGGAGYSFPRDYLRKYPDAKIDVVEIDPQMTEIARQYFRLEDHPNLGIFHEDGRVFLNRVNANQYDVMLIDAFGSLFSIPFQLTTIEAVRKMNDGLKNDGIVILNLISAIEGDASLFLQAEFRTFQEVFPHVYLFKINPEKPDDANQNLIIVACKSDCPPPEAKSADGKISELLEKFYKKPLNLSVPVLTDDLAPVEYYNSFAQKSAVQSRE